MPDNLVVLGDLLRILGEPRLWGDYSLAESIIPAEEIAAIFAEADAEDARSVALCDRLLTGPSSAWWASFRKMPETRTPGVARQLMMRIPALFERRPVDALRASSIALTIAERLDPPKFWPDYAVMVRGQALRDHALVLALVERHRQALAFVERAERTFAQIDAVSVDLAQLALVKAVVLAALRRPGDVPELLRAAKEIYLDIEDRRRYEEICLAEPALIAEPADARAMREAALRLLLFVHEPSDGRALHDRETEADAALAAGEEPLEHTGEGRHSKSGPVVLHARFDP